jgi:hypothetical protein
VEDWFNRAAFARPASNTFGNMGRNSLRGPGINKWDLSLFKNFAVAEGVRLQFRARAPVRPENDVLKGFRNSSEKFFPRSLSSRQKQRVKGKKRKR